MYAYGDRIVDASAHTQVIVGKGISHAWCNRSKSLLRMLVLFTPGSIDELFRSIAKSGAINTTLLDKIRDQDRWTALLFNNIYTRISPRS